MIVAKKLEELKKSQILTLMQAKKSIMLKPNLMLTEGPKT